MKKAVTMVESGASGYKRAAKMFDVKWQTVKDHVKIHYQKMGKSNLIISCESYFSLDLGLAAFILSAKKKSIVLSY